MKAVYLLCVSVQLTCSVVAAAQELVPSPPSRSAANATGDAAAPAALAALVAELREQLAEQRELIARNAAEIAAQRAVLVELQRQVGGAPIAPAAVNQQTASASTVHRQDPELPQKFVAAGEFPGSIEIPGTDAAFKIGAQARSTLVHSLAPLGA